MFLKVYIEDKNFMDWNIMRALFRKSNYLFNSTKNKIKFCDK